MKELKRRSPPAQLKTRKPGGRREWGGIVQKTFAFDQGYLSRVHAAALPALTEEEDGDGRDQLAESLRRYEELYDLAPVAFFTLDKRGAILGLNKAGGTLLGFRTEWLHDRPFIVFVSGGHVTHFLNLLSRMRRLPESVVTMELELSINGQPIAVQISGRLSKSQHRPVYRLAVMDLTETKAIERELKETLTNWYSLVESAPDIIMTVDRKGKITFVNRHAWGYAGKALIGTRLTDYVPEKDRAKLTKCITSAFVSDQPATCEVGGINGEKGRWYSFNFGPVRTRQMPFTTTVTIRDITAHRRTEASLRTSREELRAFANRLDQVREEERTRVAREIHDELGQALTILKLDLAWLQAKTSVEYTTRKKIKSMISDVDQTIECVRKIVSELRPSILDEMGLTAALEWQVSQFQQRTGICSSFECSSEDFKLSPDSAAALFRVVQEAMTNIVRHANAREARVALKPSRGVLRIAITDDGKGLSRQQINNRKSFGIVGMRERVHRIGGEFNIFSGPGKGTRLEVWVPLQ